MDPPESYSQQFSGASVSQPEFRRWWKQWWVQLAASVVIALLIRTFFVQSFRIATDAAAPELPRGSRVMVWKLPRSFAAGDLITYKLKGHVNVGRIMRIENGIPQVNRNGEPDAAVPHDVIIGKVFSVFWRAPNRVSSVEEQSGTIPDGFNPTGRWLSVDFVASTEQFDPQIKTCTNDLPLKEITFLPAGKTDQPWWTWKPGHLFHSGDNTDAKFFIKKISGEDCLFLEWISGDVTKKGLPPKYYVFKRASAEAQQQAGTENADRLKGTTMNRPLTLAAVSILAATNILAEVTPADFHLQEAIDSASPGDTIIVPPGTYTQPVIIRQKITLDGRGVTFKVVANQPAIQIDTSRPVSLKNLEIQYQSKSKPQKGEFPYAVYTSGGDLLIEDCIFKGSGNSETTPCAVLATEKSVLRLKSSRFDGFDYTIQLWNGSEGTVENCLIINPGHCGITVGENSSATLKQNIVSGSLYHGIRCTGGKIIADSNLVIGNKNRGFYIGNKSAVGTLSNNLIIDNGVGIDVFANSKLNIANNLILRSSYAGLSLIDTASLTVENNVIVNNERGLVGFSAEKGRDPSINLRGENLIYGNTVQAEKIKLSSKTIESDPQFADAGSGLFATSASDAKGMGLSDPTDMQVLWKKWQAATGH
ncbi:MAG: right-handed parallel beta-helix repeat-containing protein [Kiritimatiellales bacterium]